MSGASSPPRTALITGATAGIGRATAALLASNGWRVVGTGRRAERLLAMERELGGGFHGAVFDITDEAAMRAALGALPDPFRGIDLLVSNAGLGLGTALMPVSQSFGGFRLDREA